MKHLQFHTSLGAIGVTWNSRARFTRIDWYANQATETPAPNWLEGNGIFEELPGALADVVRRLFNYFQYGEPLGNIPWNLFDCQGLTDFQLQVYHVICEIPHGETRTYAWAARRLGRASATRAVGQALRKNPLPILIPCHRVVAASALGGFMGASEPDDPELVFKHGLIELENRYLNPIFSFLQAGSNAQGHAPAAAGKLCCIANAS